MATPILLLNCGSSSVKYQVIDADDEAVLATGLVQKIGLDEGTVDHTVGDRTEHLDQHIPDHADALRLVVKAINLFGPSLDDVEAGGHRTVHRG